MADKLYRWRLEDKKAVRREVEVISDFPGIAFVDGFIGLPSAMTKNELLRNAIGACNKRILILEDEIQQNRELIYMFELQLDE